MKALHVNVTTAVAWSCRSETFGDTRKVGPLATQVWSVTQHHYLWAC